MHTSVLYCVLGLDSVRKRYLVQFGGKVLLLCNAATVGRAPKHKTNTKSMAPATEYSAKLVQQHLKPVP
jgi:hypothetical protein